MRPSARARARAEGGEVWALLPARRPAPGRAPPRAIDYSYVCLKFKREHNSKNKEEFVVVGWTDPEGRRPWLGALLLA
jgi:hypothetical protein